MNKAEGTTPQQRRHARTKTKLRAALDALSSRESSAPITAAAVAREAGVGRNVLYVGHIDILEDIRSISAARTTARDKRDDAARADAIKIRDLESRLASMATEKRRPASARSRDGKPVGTRRKTESPVAPATRGCTASGPLADGPAPRPRKPGLNPRP